MKTVRDVWKSMGVGTLQVETKEQAIKAIALLQDHGVKVTRKDGTPFDARFLSNEPDFVQFTNEVIERMLDVPVRDDSKVRD